MLLAPKSNPSTAIGRRVLRAIKRQIKTVEIKVYYIFFVTLKRQADHYTYPASRNSTRFRKFEESLKFFLQTGTSTVKEGSAVGIRGWNA
jgi:hypothetical protein